MTPIKTQIETTKKEIRASWEKVAILQDKIALFESELVIAREQHRMLSLKHAKLQEMAENGSVLSGEAREGWDRGGWSSGVKWR